MRNGLLALLLLGAAACTPATQYNRGINVDYRPASAAQGQERIVGSAVKYTDKDLDALKAAGGVYLGELEVRAEKSKDLQSASGAGALDGRVSLEAAQRGASHFTLTASDIEHSIITVEIRCPRACNAPAAHRCHSSGTPCNPLQTPHQPSRCTTCPAAGRRAGWPGSAARSSP